MSMSASKLAVSVPPHPRGIDAQTLELESVISRFEWVTRWLLSV